VRKVLLIVGLVAALAVPGAALAGSGKQVPPPPVACGGPCDGGGGGSTGCWQYEWWSSGGIQYYSYFKHYLVASWCKSNGTITSLNVVVHGCDTSGFGACSTGPWWTTDGGVGYGWWSFEAHANVSTTLAKLFGYNFTDVMTGSVPAG
jgi:hypothetical protein